MFHVGQLVVCVKTWSDYPGAPPPVIVGPVAGTIYTIREAFADLDGAALVRLVEIVNRRALYNEPGWIARYEEHTFFASRFRPVDEARIEVFRKALLKSPVPH